MTIPAAAPTARREATRQRLLDAAAELFAEFGVDAASVEAVCERAGFTRGAFYSNFASKDDLMLALTERLTEQKIEQVTARMRELRATGRRYDFADIMPRLLEVAIDQRVGVLLTSEIRTRALRDRRLAETYLAWQDGMVDRVATVIADLARVYGLRPRLEPTELARLILQVFEDTAAHAVMADLDFETMSALMRERTTRLAEALIDLA